MVASDAGHRVCHRGAPVHHGREPVAIQCRHAADPWGLLVRSGGRPEPAPRLPVGGSAPVRDLRQFSEHTPEVSGASSSFYVTGGTLRHDAPSYVERQADLDLIEGLRRGEFCYVLTSRQMGKSSLMVRAAARFREEGAHVVVLDLTAIGQNLTPEQWYDGLLVRIGRQLELEEELEEHWQQHLRLSPVQRLFAPA